MTNDLKEQLQDCPFCGGQMVNKGYGAVHVAGVGCPIGNLIIDASKWNTRAPDPRITDLEARLAAAEAGEDALAGALRLISTDPAFDKAMPHIQVWLDTALAAYEARRKGN